MDCAEFSRRQRQGKDLSADTQFGWCKATAVKVGTKEMAQSAQGGGLWTGYRFSLSHRVTQQVPQGGNVLGTHDFPEEEQWMVEEGK